SIHAQQWSTSNGEFDGRWSHRRVSFYGWQWSSYTQSSLDSQLERHRAIPIPRAGSRQALRADVRREIAFGNCRPQYLSGLLRVALGRGSCPGPFNPWGSAKLKMAEIERTSSRRAIKLDAVRSLARGRPRVQPRNRHAGGRVGGLS